MKISIGADPEVFILTKAWMYLQPETEILPGQEILPDQNNIVEW